jgi:galactonate dehydratase
MKITAIESFIVAPRWLFIKVSTDEEVSGWGEGSLEGRAHTAAASVTEWSDYLIGKDPLRIEDHWQVMTKSTFYRGGAVLATAVAAIDQALWDIAGKYRGVPVYELLGGPVRDSARVYTWIGGDDPAEVADAAGQAKEAGFDAVKMNASGRLAAIDTPRSMSAIVTRASAAREALGEDLDFALDFHGRFSTAMARRVLRELEPLHPMFAEEPVRPEYTVNRLRDVVESTVIPIATGERLFSRTDFLPALQAGIAVAQPDVAHCGGISELRRIAAVAEAFDVVIAPHCPIGPIALAACLQVAFATPNFLIQEQSEGIHYNKTGDLYRYLADPSALEFVGGRCLPSASPGLGLEIDETAVRTAAREDPHWRGPIWRHSDGSWAEW